MVLGCSWKLATFTGWLTIVNFPLYAFAPPYSPNSLSGGDATSAIVSISLSEHESELEWMESFSSSDSNLANRACPSLARMVISIYASKGKSVEALPRIQISDTD